MSGTPLDFLVNAEKMTGSESSTCNEHSSNEKMVDAEGTSSLSQKLRSPSAVVVSYLIERVPEFQELAELRQKGWENPEGDNFFLKQRHVADNPDKSTIKHFYKLMKKIGNELQNTTNAFTTKQVHHNPLSILDMCMAPGGFLAIALSRNPGSRVTAFSLPISSGGHRVLLPRNENVKTKFLDITLLAEDMGVTSIPEDHPDARSFLLKQFERGQLFDLVLCDGQVLRTHDRAPYREKREARRLTTTQLALGLEHLQSGGTMIVLLHKVEAWHTVILLWTFCKFSSVKLFKPKSGHATRSSFYMIATNVLSKHKQAAMAIDQWKRIWKMATFGSDEQYLKSLGEDELSAEKILEEFGSELVDLGREAWKVQSEALSKASFIAKD